MPLAVLGDRDPRYVTHRAIDAAIEQLPEGTRWIATDSAEAHDLPDVDALWVAPGTPYRDDDAVYAAIRRARENGTPLLGTCGGFQYVVVEFARNAAGIGDATHAESDPDAAEPVIERLACSLYGEERTVAAVPGTKVADLCGTDPFPGFHFCGFGLAPQFTTQLEAAGLTVSAHGDDAGVEAVELRSHPFFVATLFQPQMGALNGDPLHPLLQELASRSGTSSARTPRPSASPSTPGSASSSTA